MNSSVRFNLPIFVVAFDWVFQVKTARKNINTGNTIIEATYSSSLIMDGRPRNRLMSLSSVIRALSIEECLSVFAIDSEAYGPKCSFL